MRSCLTCCIPPPTTAFCQSLSCAISQTHLHIDVVSCANTSPFNHTLRPALKPYLSLTCVDQHFCCSCLHVQVMSFHWLGVPVVSNNMRVFAFGMLRQISPHVVTHRTSLSTVFHPAMWKAKQNMDLLVKHVLATNIVGLELFALLAKPQVKLKPSPPPHFSHPRHLPAPVKLPQFLSVQCRPAHFLIERCSEVQERGGAQWASVFGLAQKCFSWLNPLILRSSYNKLKGPNCPQGKGLATIDMWWDKSPVLLHRYPHPSLDRGDEHVSSVYVALWVVQPQVQHC